MILLALDSATEACSAALWRDGEISERYEVIGRGHAERLLPMADELLREAGVPVTALDAIAFGRGPGSFTGLRIAAGIAQGLAAGGTRRVVPVSNLAALAAGAARELGADHLLVCMDAHLGQVYWACFDCSSGLPVATSRELLSDPKQVEVPAGTTWHGAGHGLAAYPEIATRLATFLLGCDPAALPRAADIARIAAVEVAAGRTVDAAAARPVYLRDDVVHRR